MNVVLIIVLLTVGDMARTGAATTAYFAHIDLCEAAAKRIGVEIDRAGGRAVITCHHATGASK